MAEQEVLLEAASDDYTKYEQCSLFISPFVPANLTRTYEQYIEGREPGRYIYENYIRKIRPGATSDWNLGDVIAICTYIALSKENLDLAIRTYREIRRINKKNWIAPIKEEMSPAQKLKPRNPQYLKKYVDSAMMLSLMDRSAHIDASPEELKQKKYEEVLAWQSDTSSAITDFQFLLHRPAKSIANSFINDVTYESLLIIRDHLGGNIEGFSTRYPQNISKHPIFSFRSAPLVFEAELLGNELSLFNKFEYEDEDSNIEGSITIQYKPDIQLPQVKSKRSVSKVLKDYNIDLMQDSMDSLDETIATQLFNLINGETLNDKSIVVNLRDLIRKVYRVKTPRDHHYQDLNNRLEKIKSFDYTINIRDRNTGNVIESTSLGLINYYSINYKENYLQFTPSDQLISAYVKHQYTSIVTDAYESIDSPQTRTIMMLLQQERLSEFMNGSAEKRLTLKYFRIHLKLIRIKNSVLIKELTRHFNVLKEKGIVIKDYEFINKNSSVHIFFAPLSEKERVAYNFHGKSLDLTSDIIDMANLEDSGKQ